MQTRKPAFSWVGLDGLAQVLNKLLYGYSRGEKEQRQLSILFSDQFNLDYKINELLGAVVVSQGVRGSMVSKNGEKKYYEPEMYESPEFGLDGPLSTSFVTKKSAFSICPKYFRPFDQAPTPKPAKDCFLQNQRSTSTKATSKDSGSKSINTSGPLSHSKPNPETDQKNPISGLLTNSTEFTPFASSIKKMATLHQNTKDTNGHEHTTASTSDYSLHSPIKHQRSFGTVLKDVTNIVNNQENKQVKSFDTGLEGSGKNQLKKETKVSEFNFIGKDYHGSKAYDKFQQSGKKSVKMVHDLINDLDMRFDAIEHQQDLLMKRNPGAMKDFSNSHGNLNLKKRLKSDQIPYPGKENIY